MNAEILCKWIIWNDVSEILHLKVNKKWFNNSKQLQIAINSEHRHFFLYNNIIGFSHVFYFCKLCWYSQWFPLIYKNMLLF